MLAALVEAKPVPALFWFKTVTCPLAVRESEKNGYLLEVFTRPITAFIGLYQDRVAMGLTIRVFCNSKIRVCRATAISKVSL
jgi:hypothetical protein